MRIELFKNWEIGLLHDLKRKLETLQLFSNRRNSFIACRFIWSLASKPWRRSPARSKWRLPRRSVLENSAIKQLHSKYFYSYCLHKSSTLGISYREVSTRELWWRGFLLLAFLLTYFYVTRINSKFLLWSLNWRQRY